jgi:hypothetical protein
MSHLLRVKATVHLPIVAIMDVANIKTAQEAFEQWLKDLDREGWDELLLLEDGEATLTVESFEEA